jgi:hypothetical protein
MISFEKFGSRVGGRLTGGGKSGTLTVPRPG